MKATHKDLDKHGASMYLLCRFNHKTTTQPCHPPIKPHWYGSGPQLRHGSGCHINLVKLYINYFKVHTPRTACDIHDAIHRLPQNYHVCKLTSGGVGLLPCGAYYKALGRMVRMLIMFAALTPCSDTRMVCILPASSRCYIFYNIGLRSKNSAQWSLYLVVSSTAYRREPGTPHRLSHTSQVAARFGCWRNLITTSHFLSGSSPSGKRNTSNNSFR